VPIRRWIEGSQPLAGTAATEESEPLRFDGWLELPGSSPSCRCAAQHLSAPGAAGDGADAAVRGETGDQTGQESRSTGPQAAPSLTAMDITTTTSGVTMTGPSTQGIKTVLHTVSDLAAARAAYAALLGVPPQTDGSYDVGGGRLVARRP
jgi:hypothetical protein